MPSDQARDLEQPLIEEPTNGKKRSTLLTVCPYILGSELCERLAYNGLATNLVIYLQTVMGESAASAAIQQMMFEGTCYLTPLLGALLADSRWGRYKTILVFSAIYFVGLLCLAASACIPGWTPTYGQKATWWQNGLLFFSLYVVALGTGGIKPNVSAFGADQFDETNPTDRREKKSFFNYFYLVINIGSLVAVTVVVYIQVEISWAIGFAIPAATMAIAVLIFVGGSSLYKHVQPTESPMSRVVKVLWAAAKHRKDTSQEAAQARAWADAQGGTGVLSAGSIAEALQKSHSYQWLDKAVDGHDPSPETPGAGGLAGFSAEQVEEVRMVVRMLPVFCATILFWTIYAQMGSFFVEQGSIMDRRMGGGWKIPAASLSLFNTLSIIVLIPLYDRGLVPLLRRMGLKISLLSRIGWGLGACILAMLAAAGLEQWRLQMFRQGRVVPQLHHHQVVVDLSVFWQTGQYLLIGLSEMLASIGSLEFFYDQAPDVMRSCCMALQLLSVAIGSYLSGALVLGVADITARLHLNHGLGWLPPELNLGRLDLFFYFLAGLSAINLLFFLWVASRYQYKAVAHRASSLAPPREGSGQGQQDQQRRSPPAYLRPHTVAGPSREIMIQGGARPEEDVGQYGRSLAFRAESPVLPAAFR